MGGVQITPVTGIGGVKPGDDLAAMLLGALENNGVSLRTGDVLVVAQKIVSKAEGCYRDLGQVSPSSRARELAETVDKDPRLVELVLEESTAIIRAVPGVLITRHRSGFVMANAGIDASNLPDAATGDVVLLLPKDADASAAALRQDFVKACGHDVAVVVADSFGRPWRNGVTNVAIGVAGLPALVDRRSEKDLAGRELKVTQVAVGDLVAGAAGLVMGEGAEGIPAAHLRGLAPLYRGVGGVSDDARTLVRPFEQDLFR